MKKLFLFLLVISPATCFAGTWTGSGEIEQIYPYSDRNIIYIRHSVAINPDSCTGTSYYALPKSNIMLSEMYSLLYLGIQLKKQRNVYINGCEGGYPKVVMSKSKND